MASEGYDHAWWQHGGGDGGKFDYANSYQVSGMYTIILDTTCIGLGNIDRTRTLSWREAHFWGDTSLIEVVCNRYSLPLERSTVVCRCAVPHPTRNSRVQTPKQIVDVGARGHGLFQYGD